MLAQYRLGTRADLATQQTELVALEPELIDLSEPAESQPTLETTIDTDPDAETQLPSPSPDESVSVEFEALPPRLSVPASHRHPVTGTAQDSTTIRSEEQPVPDGSAE